MARNRPALQAFSDIPVSTIAGADTVQSIASILATHDRGQLFDSARLWDAMRRDDRITGVMRTRVGALVASPLEIKPANGKAKAERVARELAGDGQDDVGLWDTICPQHVIKALSEWGNGLGIGVAEIVWDTGYQVQEWTPVSPGVAYAAPSPMGAAPSTKARWLPRLRLWHPQFLYFDWSEYRFHLICREGTVPLPNIDEQPHSDGKWVIWAPYGYKYGWLAGLVRSLADKYLMRGWDYRDWARYNERHGLPLLVAQTPADAEKDVKENFARSLSTLGSDAVVETPQIDGENKYDVKLVEATARSFDSFDKFKSQLDTDIAILILGQNLTTEVKQGSRAAAQVQNLVRIDKAIEDAGIAQCIRQQVLTWWALYNFGDPELAPRPEYQVEPPEDELKEATALKMLGDALGSLKAAAAPIDVRTILDRAGVPMISEEEEAAQKAIAAEEQAARMQAMQQAGGGGDGADGGNEGGDGAAGGDGANGAPPGKEKQVANAALGASTRIPLPPPVKRYEFQGLPIAVENPAGSIRVWRETGPEGGIIGSTTMLHDYGYIDGHMGSDGEELDCYVGPDETAPNVHIIHQMAPPDFERRDEDKVMLGFREPNDAKAAYVAHRNDGERAIGGISITPIKIFKAKLRRRTGTGKIRATAVVQLVIREENGRWNVYAEDGKHMGGPYDTKAEAVERLRQIEGHKAHSGLETDLERHRQTIEALVRFVDRIEQPAVLRSRRSPEGRRRASAYGDNDRLVASAKRQAARALAVDLSAMQEEIDACHSYEDLRKRILVRYRHSMAPEKLATVVEKARLLAYLGGRLSAQEQV